MSVDGYRLDLVVALVRLGPARDAGNCASVAGGIQAAVVGEMRLSVAELVSEN